MNLEEMIAAARERADDDTAPYACSPEDWTRFANDAQREACRRARLIVDSSTAEVCEITIDAGTAEYDIDPRILRIRRAKLGNRSVPLQHKSYRDLDRECPGWEDDTGEPVAYITDQTTGKLRLYPEPTGADTLTLTATRLPLVDMAADDDEPEIRAHLHESLVHWMVFRYYTRPGSETKDPTKAAEVQADFEREFGPKSSAIDEAWLERNADFLDEEGNL